MRLNFIFAPFNAVMRFLRYRKDNRTIICLNGQFRGRYLGLGTALLRSRGVMDALRSSGTCLCTACKLRHLLCLVSWQEALGLLGLLCWAVAALTLNMWTCFPGGDTLSWLGMQLSLTLAGGHRWWALGRMIGAFWFTWGIYGCFQFLLMRRRAMLTIRDHRRRVQQAATLHQADKCDAPDPDTCTAVTPGSVQALPSALPPAPPLPDETWFERLGVPTVEYKDQFELLCYALPFCVGAVWAADPTGPLAGLLCKIVSGYWSVSFLAAFLCFWLPLLIVAGPFVAANMLEGHRWRIKYDAYYRYYKTAPQAAHLSNLALMKLARRCTEEKHGKEPPSFAASTLRCAIAVLMGGVLVSWALRPGYLPAQVVGAWPWQGPQPWLSVGGSVPWVWAVGRVGAPAVCYAPGSYPVVHHHVGLPSAQVLWQAGLAAVGLRGRGSPSQSLVAGELHPSYDTMANVRFVDLGGYLARAARVNLLAARAWRQHGLEGVRGAMAALRALQTAGGNETAAAAALEELRRVQLPASATPVPLNGKSSQASALSAPSAAGGGAAAGSELDPQRPSKQQGSGSDGGKIDVKTAARAKSTSTRKQSNTPAPATRPPELALDAASSLHQHLLALALAVVVTPLLLAAQARWDIKGLVMNPERLLAATMTGVAWGLEGLTGGSGRRGGSSARGKRAGGASGSKRARSGGRQHQQQPVSHRSVAQQQEQQRQQGQPAEVQATAEQITEGGMQLQQTSAGAAVAALQREASVAGPKPKGRAVRQPAAVPTRTEGDLLDRQKGRSTHGAAGSEERTADDGGGSRWGNEGTRQKQKQAPAAQPAPTSGTVSAADAAAALCPVTAQLASSNNSTSSTADANLAASAHANPQPSWSAPTATTYSDTARLGSSFPAPTASAQTAPPAPGPRPRPVAVPVNPRAVRPATFREAIGGRIHAAPQPTATAPASTAPSSASPQRPVVPVPIPVINDTPLGPAVPAAPARLNPRGPNGLPTAPPPADFHPATPASTALGFLGLNPALANYLMGRTARSVTSETASVMFPGTTDAVGAGESPAAVTETHDEEAAASAPAHPHVCIRCRVSARQVGFLHGDAAHVCLCRGCSSALGLKDGDPCPQCGEPCARVLHIF